MTDRFMLPDAMYNWANWGNGLLNDRYARHETKIGPGNVGSLTVKKGWPVRVWARITPLHPMSQQCLAALASFVCKPSPLRYQPASIPCPQS
jgi:hypothetical protein